MIQLLLEIIKKKCDNEELFQIVYSLLGEYNAKEDTFQYKEEHYKCEKETKKTEYGEQIIYTCNYEEE